MSIQVLTWLHARTVAIELKKRHQALSKERVGKMWEDCWGLMNGLGIRGDWKAETLNLIETDTPRDYNCAVLDTRLASIHHHIIIANIHDTDSRMKNSWLVKLHSRQCDWVFQSHKVHFTHNVGKGVCTVSVVRQVLTLDTYWVRSLYLE